MPQRATSQPPSMAPTMLKVNPIACRTHPIVSVE